MMRILNSFLRLNKQLGFWAIVLIPFGSLSGLLVSQQAWHGFDAQDPVLLVARAQKFRVGGERACESWIHAFVRMVPDGVKVDFSKDLLPLEKGWQSWDEDDLELISDCDEFPCKVKLNKNEVMQLASVSKDHRQVRFIEVVGSRVQRYVQTQERDGYEFPGIPVDPWAIFEQRGFVTSLRLSTRPVLWARKLNFESSIMQSVRQVVDRRISYSLARGQAVMWFRDVYTDHYFDSWGEWTWLSCDKRAGEITVLQALLVEFDLLKQKDLFAVLSRGKMRKAVEKNGSIYLDRQFERIKKAAIKF